MKASSALKDVLALMTLCVMVGAYQTEPQNRQSEAVIDLVDCKESTHLSYSKFGSEKISVKGRRGSKCVIERTSETEGAYVRSECRVPVSLGSLSVAEKSEAMPVGKNNCDVRYLSDVKKYCKVIKTGNLLNDN
jgi:hypothetical protein